MNKKDLFKAYNGDEDYIFVSYNHDDSEIVYEIISDFYRRGYRLWHDSGIELGDNFVQVLARKVKNCRLFFCFLSPRYIEAPYCMRELNFALSNHRKIIPIKLESFELPEAVKFILSAINWTNLSWFDSPEEFVAKFCDLSKDSLAPCYAGPPEVPDLIGEDPVHIIYNDGETPADDQNDHAKIQSQHDPRSGKAGAQSGAGDQSGNSGAGGGQNKPGIGSSGGDDDGSGGGSGSGAGSGSGGGGHVPGFREKNKTRIITALLVIAALAVFLIYRTLGGDQQTPPPPDPTPVPSASPAAPAAPIPTVKPEDLASSGQKALTYLSGRVKNGCPLTVYDPKGSTESEADPLYDNAAAALALLSDCVKNKNHSDTDLKQILDAIVAQADSGAIFSSETGTKSLAAASLALMQYDRARSSFTCARAAQKILDHVLESRSSEAGGFSRSSTSVSRSTADNLYLAAAFTLLHEKTGNSAYEEAARSAETFVRTMRSSDGSCYLAGDQKERPEDSDLLSVEVQALAAIVMNDRTGIARASALRRSDGGFPPDDRSSDGFSMESTALMALACQTLDLKDESAQALSAVYRFQLGDGGIPEANTASLSDASGRVFTNLPRTSAAAWYAIAAAGYNPFVP